MKTTNNEYITLINYEHVNKLGITIQFPVDQSFKMSVYEDSIRELYDDTTYWYSDKDAGFLGFPSSEMDSEKICIDIDPMTGQILNWDAERFKRFFPTFIFDKCYSQEKNLLSNLVAENDDLMRTALSIKKQNDENYQDSIWVGDMKG